MALSEKRDDTSADYWGLPENERAELIDGRLYAMAPPGLTHQILSLELAYAIRDYIRSHNGACRVLTAPFAVNLNADARTWLEPDLMVVCDMEKLSERCCQGAPDFIIEIVSPASRKMDYVKKNALYLDAGVKEYWIVDPLRKHTLVYCYDEEMTPVFYPFEQAIPAGIFPGFEITVAKLLENVGA